MVGNSLTVYHNPTSKTLMVLAETVNYPTLLFTVTSAGNLFTTSDSSQVVPDPPSSSVPCMAVLPLQKATASLHRERAREPPLHRDRRRPDLLRVRPPILDAGTRINQVAYLHAYVIQHDLPARSHHQRSRCLS
jgi:hypothetical protein